MKRQTKVLALLLAALMICTLFVGCKKNNEAMTAAAGTYVGDYGKFVGDTDDNRVTDEEFKLVLKADGTGTHHRDGMEFDVTWKLDGENFSMSETFIGDPIEYTGTLKDGKLDIFNGDPTDIWTYEYVYTKN